MDNSTLFATARQLFETVAHDVFHTLDLYPNQFRVLERLTLLKIKGFQINPLYVLFIQPTSGGNSLVRDVHYVLFRGVSSTIVPILYLDTYQKRKVLQNTS